jgi:hypothetical protein
MRRCHLRQFRQQSHEQAGGDGHEYEHQEEVGLAAAVPPRWGLREPTIRNKSQADGNRCDPFYR